VGIGMTDLILQKFQTDAVFTTKSISKSKAKDISFLSVILFGGRERAEFTLGMWRL